MSLARALSGLVSLVAVTLASGCSSDSAAPATGGDGSVAGKGGSGTAGSALGGSAASGGSSSGSGGATVLGRAGAAGSSGAAVSGGGAGAAGGNSGIAGSGGAGPDTAALDAACTPEFELEQTDTGSKGQIFTDAVGGDPEAFVQAIGRGVCRILYREPEEVRAANHITLIIEEDQEGVAWKAGDVGNISVGISTNHLQSVKNDGRDVANEIRGILFHEMTHMYQNDDKPENTYEHIANMYEGIADAVRIRAGFTPSGARPTDKSGNWYDKTYASQAFFWLFADTKYPDFLYRLNQSMKKDGVPWQPEVIQTLTGQSADDLWSDYQDSTCCDGDDRSCCQ